MNMIAIDLDCEYTGPYERLHEISVRSDTSWGGFRGYLCRAGRAWWFQPRFSAEHVGRDQAPAVEKAA